MSKDRTSVLQRSSQESSSMIALCSLIGSSSDELLDPCISFLEQEDINVYLMWRFSSQ